jgi:hypothetical protein
MADITASTALRDFIAGRLSTAGGCYMWATLHSAATNLAAGTVYAASGLLELTNGNGYTAGGTTCGTITRTNGTLDTPDVVWPTGSGQTLTAGCVAIWINSTNSITGASLVCVKDSAQTASNTGTLTAGLTNTIVIPTPA